jgi:hypothetical protein
VYRPGGQPAQPAAQQHEGQQGCGSGHLRRS